MKGEKVMTWLKHHLPLAFLRRLGYENTIIVRDNVPHYHGGDPDIRVPGSNTKLYNTKMLQRYGVKHLHVACEVEDDRGSTKDIDFQVKAPHERSVFLKARSKNDRKKEVA